MSSGSRQVETWPYPFNSRKSHTPDLLLSSTQVGLSQSGWSLTERVIKRGEVVLPLMGFFTREVTLKSSNSFNCRHFGIYDNCLKFLLISRTVNCFLITSSKVS